MPHVLSLSVTLSGHVAEGALSLPLPASGEPSNIDPQSGAGTQWQLNVVVPTRGFKDESVFDLPVRA